VKAKSKAQHIRKLYAKGLSTREIADEVGCDPGYVRVVARQRDASGISDADKRYVTKRYGSLQAYWKVYNDRRQEQRSVYYRDRYQNDPKYRDRVLSASRAYKAKKRAAQRSESR
jgi:hypothetical protein